MGAVGAFGWALAAAVDRVLAGRTIGYGLNIQRDGMTFVDHEYGYARSLGDHGPRYSMDAHDALPHCQYVESNHRV